MSDHLQSDSVIIVNEEVIKAAMKYYFEHARHMTIPNGDADKIKIFTDDEGRFKSSVPVDLVPSL